MTDPFRSIDHGSTTCDVYLGQGLFDRLDELTARWSPRFAVVGKGVNAVLGERLRASLGSLGEPIEHPDGETAKNLAGVEAIVTELLRRGAKRDATIIVIGGGVTGDTVGFAAAVYLRGVRLVHVPTTLLAQVDSSIGGKTAVNHPLGKNLIGAFHPPSAVISDVSVLRSLPRREILSGLYEALKTGVIGDPELFELIENERQRILETDDVVLDEIVRRCVEVKGSIVECDERERDLRRLLNYGHTIGHGIEAALSYEGLTHGEAVAWGMLAANEIAVRRRLLDRSTAERIGSAITSYAPTPPSGASEPAVFAATAHDKKFSSKGMVMILPVGIGECRIVDDITEDEIRVGIRAVLDSR